MTKQEAIELLKRATMFEPTLENRDYPEAFDLAIKALMAYRDCGACKHNVKIGNMRGCNANGCEYEQRGEEDD